MCETLLEVMGEADEDVAASIKTERSKTKARKKEIAKKYRSDRASDPSPSSPDL